LPGRSERPYARAAAALLFSLLLAAVAAIALFVGGIGVMRLTPIEALRYE
jgi:hypothetical protein